MSSEQSELRIGENTIIVRDGEHIVSNSGAVSAMSTDGRWMDEHKVRSRKKVRIMSKFGFKKQQQRSLTRRARKKECEKENEEAM